MKLIVAIATDEHILKKTKTLIVYIFSELSHSNNWLAINIA